MSTCALCRQFLLRFMRRRHKAQVDIQGLSRFVCAADGAWGAPFFCVACGGGHRPASSSMRLTVLGLTNGTQLLPLANSSAIRLLPHSGYWRRRAMTCSSSSLGLQCTVLGA